MNEQDWKPLKELNIPLFYGSYTDSISVESLYQTFKTRMEVELYCAVRSEKKKKKPLRRKA